MPDVAKYYKDESRKNWYRALPEGRGLDDDALKLGAILRIADATEAMAKRHTDLIRERDSYENLYRHAEERERTLQRKLAAAKGQITKLQKRLAVTQKQAFGGNPDDVKLGASKP